MFFSPVLRQYLHVKHHRDQQHQFLGNAILKLSPQVFFKQIIVDQRSILGESQVFIQILDIPIPSMYIHVSCMVYVTFIYHKNQPNVGEYTIHGCYGIDILWTQHLYIPCCYRIFWTPHVFFRIFMSRKPSENQWKFLAGDFHFHLSDVFPITSMNGIFTYIWLICVVNEGKYTIHGWYGNI